MGNERGGDRFVDRGVLRRAADPVREMTAEERASLQSAAGARRPAVWHTDGSRETWGLAAAWILTLVVIVSLGRVNEGGIAAAMAVGAIVVGSRLVVAARARAHRRKYHEEYAAHRAREVARVLEDGRVTVRRVRAVAVVEIEPLEDEGTGYVFDLGDGRVLFIKGNDYVPVSAEAPWPNTEFEIVRAAANGDILDVHCHGAPLLPLRVVPRDDVDPEVGWDAREAVLHLSMDEAVRTVLLDR